MGAPQQDRATDDVPGRAAPRVLLVHSSDEMYGADRILLQVAQAIRDHAGSDVEVWLPHDSLPGAHALSAELTRRGVTWRRVRMPVLRRAYLSPPGLVRLAAVAFSAARQLRRSRPDLVYLGNSSLLLLAPVAALAGVRRRVVHVQERWSGREGDVLRYLARWTGVRIAISPWVARATGLDPAPVVVENCVDDPAARLASSAATSGPADAVADDARGPRFVVASRWNRWKGHGTLLTAWELAGCPGELVVLGGPPPIGDAVDVPGLVTATVSRPDSVRVVGEVADAAPFITDADALVLPSDEPEPFGLVVIEAFGLSRPVVASRAGGPADVVEEGRNGWLYEPGDAEALAAVLRSLDRPTMAAAGVHARELFDERFRTDRYRQRIAEVVRAALGPA